MSDEPIQVELTRQELYIQFFTYFHKDGPSEGLWFGTSHQRQVAQGNSPFRVRASFTRPSFPVSQEGFAQAAEYLAKRADIEDVYFTMARFNSPTAQTR